MNRHEERTTYVYDGLGRVTTMTHGNESLAQHDYDAAGRITGVVEANGDRVTRSHDAIYHPPRPLPNVPAGR